MPTSNDIAGSSKKVANISNILETTASMNEAENDNLTGYEQKNNDKKRKKIKDT